MVHGSLKWRYNFLKFKNQSVVMFIKAFFYLKFYFFFNNNHSVQFSSVAQSCPTLYSSMNHTTRGLPVYHQLPKSTQTHVHWVGDAIQPSHPPPAPNPSQHQGLFQWVNSSHQVAKLLEFSFNISPSQWTPRTDLL